MNFGRCYIDRLPPTLYRYDIVKLFFGRREEGDSLGHLAPMKDINEIPEGDRGGTEL